MIFTTKTRWHRLGTAAAAAAIGVGVMSFAGAAEAAVGDVVLASTSDSGVKGDSASHDPVISADGGTVAFDSYASNLDPADTDILSDVYVKDLATGDIVLASTSDAEVRGYWGSYGPSLSADGGIVAFSSDSRLDPADTDTRSDVYVKDLVTGRIVLASTSDTGVKGIGGSSSDVSLSADGGTVAFESYTRLDPADTDIWSDVYVKNLASGDIVLASTSDTGVQGRSGNSGPSLSADGGTVAFYSYASLDPADLDTRLDVYVKDLASGDVVLASTSHSGVKGNNDSDDPSLSADGARVAFRTNSTNLDPADTDFLSDVYVKDLASGDIVLVSTSDNGVKGNSGSSYPSLSADGSVVAFYTSATNLDPEDYDANDVYVKDLVSGDIVLASTSDTGAQGNSLSYDPSLSADGGTLAFKSQATNLDPADTNRDVDVYVKTLSTRATLAIGNETRVEGDRGGTLMAFGVTLSEPSTSTVTLDFATVDSSATAGSDYQARSGTLSFRPGTTRQFIVIRALGDTVVEAHEKFTIDLSNPSGATIADGVGIGGIRNDD